MSTMSKHSLKYVVGISVLLVTIALYLFFLMADALQASAQASNNRRASNNALATQSQRLESKVLQLEEHLAEQTRRLAQANVLTSRLQNDQASLQAQCQSMSSAEAVSALEEQRDNAQENAQRCAVQLNDRLAQAQRLEITAKDNSKLQKELQSAQSNVKALEDQLATLRTSNKKLRSDLVELADVEQNQRIEIQLAQANQQISALRDRLNQVLTQNEELIVTARRSDVLEITEFQATPNFCDKVFSQTTMCLASVEITAGFNFSPTGFIAIKLIDPSGDTIKRTSIAASRVNRVVLELDEQQPSLFGEYQIEFKNNDVLNPFNQSLSFTLLR